MLIVQRGERIRVNDELSTNLQTCGSAAREGGKVHRQTLLLFIFGLCFMVGQYTYSNQICYLFIYSSLVQPINVNKQRL